LPTPVAAGSSGLSGKTSKMPAAEDVVAAGHGGSHLGVAEGDDPELPIRLQQPNPRPLLSQQQ